MNDDLVYIIRAVDSDRADNFLPDVIIDHVEDIIDHRHQEATKTHKDECLHHLILLACWGFSCRYGSDGL